MGWMLSHQSSRKCPTGLSRGQSDEGNPLVEIPSSQIQLGLCQVDKQEASNKNLTSPEGISLLGAHPKVAVNIFVYVINGGKTATQHVETENFPSSLLFWKTRGRACAGSHDQARPLGKKSVVAPAHSTSLSWVRALLFDPHKKHRLKGYEDKVLKC